MSTAALFKAIKADVGNQGQKLVLIVLADVANEKGECWPSHKYIAKKAECSVRTVIRALNELESKGFVYITKRSKKGFKTSNLYRICDMTDCHNDVSDCHNSSDTVSHNTLNTPTINILYKGIDISGVPDRILPSVKEFIDHRKIIKKPLTQNGLIRQMKAAERAASELGISIQQVIEETIDAGWQGIRADWLAKRMGVANGKTGQDSRGSQDTRRLSAVDRVKLKREQRRQEEQRARTQ